MLRQLDDDLWVVDHAFAMAGLRVGTRSTVIRLSDGGLFLHSPGPLDVQLSKQLDEIGPIRCIVAPNKFHHIFVSENAKAYQAASVHLAPGLAQKKKQLSYNEELTDEAPELWAREIDQTCMDGLPASNEVVFLHKRTHTLLLTDLAFNFQYSSSRMTRIFLKLNNAYGRFTPSRMIRMLARDRVAARASVLRILEWDFDRVIVSHGEVLEKGGKDAVRAGFDWLL